MSDHNKVVVNNVEKGQRDNLLKVRGKGRPFANIQMPVSSDDRGGGGESAKRRILRRSGTPRGQPGAVQQRAWSTRLSDRSSVAPSAYS
jgi:hypothetical protein